MGKIDYIYEDDDSKLLNKLYKYNFILKWKQSSKSYDDLELEIDAYFTQDKLLAFIEIKDAKNLKFDLCTTKSWFQSKNTYFKLRQEFFSYFNKEQIQRKNEKHKELFSYSSDKEKNKMLEILSVFINSRTTINSLITIIKGNNPTGSHAKKEAAELKGIINERVVDNLVMFLDLISYSKKLKSRFWEVFLKNRENNKIKIYEINNLYSFLDSSLNQILDFLSLNKQDRTQEKTNRIKLLCEEVKQRKNYLFNFEESLDSIIKKERTKVPTKIKEVNFLQFSNDYVLQKAHIFPVWKTKENIKNKFKDLLFSKYSSLKNEDLISKEKLEQWIYNTEEIKEISDENNIIALPINIHSAYDDKKFYWDPQNGNLIFLNNVSPDVLHIIKNYQVNLDFQAYPKRKFFIQKYYDEIIKETEGS
ncbi:MAG4270 family putative restriction endonuclease [Mycoplasma procyoni]|uniref:MAG4270 family putative restriction endonuclease n=1 Tax=Mycoplasma procyoni TaxID=568784 RepID=UPI00197C91D1|nr:HNH endonuclease [Mycoplasma procyoni]MBN3534966.1 HNH endonuclease [Mycoplasma procyoni]